MPSITSYTAELPSSTGYFKGDTAGVSSTAYYYPQQSSFNFAVGTPSGCTGVDGTNIYFDSYTSVRSWLQSSGTTTRILIVDSDFFRDMGKTFTIFVQQEKSTGGYIYLPVAKITKAQKNIAPGERTEGPTGNPLGAASLAGYNTVYLVTWTANPSTVSGIPVGVVRVGYQ